MIMTCCRLHLAKAKATWKPLASKVLRRPGTLLLIAAVRSSQRHCEAHELPGSLRPGSEQGRPEALEKQQRRGCYWTLIAPPGYSNHEWLAQPTPEAIPAGLACRVRRVVRELDRSRRGSAARG